MSPALQNYTETTPSRHMLRWAEQVWQFKAAVSGSSIILPDARSDIMFRYRQVNELLTELVPIITVPARSPFSVQYQAGDEWFGVRLKPEHTSALCKLAPSLLHASALRGEQAASIMSVLGLNTGVLKSASQLEDALTILLSNLSDVQLIGWLKPVIDHFHITGGRAKLSDVAAARGVGVRQLHRGFLKHVGVSPKDYCSVVRFHRSLRLLQKSGIGIADVAFETGYADQSHMTREFMRFGGFTPNKIPPNISLPGLPI